ncbi:predicted protein [Nematostella vectensis]|uniref:C-type lectin domain-containing protein n=1 Tax=Nematostella vectensis TaxID=45351 RepID=A7T8E0_NEMVE|nr:predicted protein [Nematostella vectensis]|eukprot:XP_001619847.1 hypothetical protein NEMVEDRAFT_v1g223756 [Nematostella vectensis]
MARAVLWCCLLISVGSLSSTQAYLGVTWYWQRWCRQNATSMIYETVKKTARDVSFIKAHIEAENVPSCLPGWVKFKSSCYIVLDVPTNKWTIARRACQALGGDLVKITSPQQNKFVADLGIKGTVLPFMWIGLHRGGDASFLWVDGTTLTSSSYSAWYPPQPDNSGGHENCGHFLLSGKLARRWNDISCNNSYQFAIACQKKLD